MPDQKYPLVIDLDGTLLRSDLLIETAASFVRENPLRILEPLGWLAHGKAQLKERLAQASSLDVGTLPYDSEVIALIEEARAAGRSVVLATASHHTLAESIAKHLGLFDEVLATRDGINLSARHKRDRLIERFGAGGFDYAGNSRDDLPVWSAARHAYVVNPEPGVESRARACGNVLRVIRSNPASPVAWAQALRLHQWAKNALLFVPLLTSHQLTHLPLLLDGLLAFFFFGLCASSVYLLNDLLDVADDRHHHWKRERPFASGRLSVKQGLITFPVLLLISGIGSALLLPWPFLAALAIYWLLTLGYSFFLKRIVAADVITLALLYTTRIIAGAAAFALQPSFWLLAFSLFLFLGLALVKRYAELQAAQVQQNSHAVRGRDYYPTDLGIIASLGAASGYISVMVLALYIHDPDTFVLYSNPQVIWLACPLLLYWITRIWILTHRGQMHEDPVVFALRDRVSLLIGTLFCIVFWLAV